MLKIKLAIICAIIVSDSTHLHRKFICVFFREKEPYQISRKGGPYLVVYIEAFWFDFDTLTAYVSWASEKIKK